MADYKEQLVDELLVMECQDGNATAMELLVSRWQKRLWRYACRLTDDPEAAWDVTQESWLAIARGMRRLQDPTRFRAWAYRITTNKANDWMRANTRARPSPADEVAGAQSDGETRNSEDTLDLQNLMRRLPAQSRTILTLHYLEELRLCEIARVLHIPQGTVKSRLHTARRELKELWRRDVQ